ncbi:MAG: GNAT family N-acetyltransferase [Agriterribacter sp.]
MKSEVIKTGLNEILHLRVLFLQENNFQFIYDKCHTYGWADTYLFKLNGTSIGYGAIWGQNKREDRDAIFEFYIIRPYRKFASTFFLELLEISRAIFIECQSNDSLLSEMLYAFGKNINAEAFLFKDNFQTFFEIDRASVHKQQNNNTNPDYVLKYEDEVIATGGLMLNYNMPYADIYYEVNEQHRQKGFGSFLIQELKRQAYLSGRVPAARCNINNLISKATLLRAGFKICGFILKGEINKTTTDMK